MGVPTLHRYDLLRRLIASVNAGTLRPNEIVIVDNGGKLVNEPPLTPPDVPVWTRFVLLDGEGVNWGVAASWNAILKKYPDDNVLMSGDDVVVEPDTIEKMVRAAERSKRLFLIAKGASSWAFFLQKPELAKKIGYYDEKFWPAYYEDNDYHRRMLLAGEDYEMAEGAVVSHDVSSTLNSLPPEEKKKFEAEIDKNSRYYGIKWGGPPGNEKLTEPNPDAVNHR